MHDKELASILQEEPLQPLALVPLTEEEQVNLASFGSHSDLGLGCCVHIIHLIISFQRNFSMSVNSVAVLRLMGKGGGTVPTGVPRGRGTARGGRGKLSPEHSGRTLA